MKKTLLNPVLIFVFFWTINPRPGYAQISISLKYPSAFQFVPGDLWNVTIINNGTQTQNVYLVGTVKDNSQNPLIKVTSMPFLVSPGTHIYSPSNIGTATINYFNAAAQQALAKSGQFPSGGYISCVEAVNYVNNIQFNENCVENTVEVIFPPHLVNPTDHQILDNPYPVFDWTPATPLRPSEQIDYRIKIVELADSQPPGDGILRNEAFYQSDLQNVLLLSYAYSNLPFDESKTYAWQITAYIEDYEIGPSEIWSFTYKPKPVDSSVYGLDNDYLLLNGKGDGAYYLAKGCVKFRINDQYLTGIKSVRLLTPSNTDITPSNISLKRPFKDERYVIDLRNMTEVEDQKYYLLSIKTVAGQSYTIRFKYLEPGKGL